MERDLRDLDDLLGRLVVRQKQADQGLSHLERLETQGDASRAWAQSVGMLQMFPGLRGLWPMSPSGSAGGATDLSGHGQNLSLNGDPVYNVDNLAPYVELDGAGDYLSRVSTAAHSVTGTESHIASAVQGLTLGGWFYSATGGSSGAGLITKSENSGSGWTYQIDMLSDKPRIALGDGSSINTAISPITIQRDTWFFAAGRFTPSAERATFVDGTWAKETSGVHSALTTNTHPLEIGNDAANDLLTGRASLCFLCAAAVPDILIETFYQYSKGLFS